MRVMGLDVGSRTVGVAVSDLWDGLRKGSRSFESTKMKMTLAMIVLEN